MRWIYLSPHLDDAVLSAGGLIYEQARSGAPVEIWTLMCGYPSEDAVSPFARVLHSMWGFSSAEETVRIRRDEDRNAAARVGARTVHFDFLDCIYRRGPDGEWLYEDVFGGLHAQDAGLPARIAQAISSRLQPDDRLICQLAVGSHVDHVLVRQGAELLGRSLLYAIDVPYILFRPEQLQLRTSGLESSVYPITEEGLSSWQDAALEYKSQIPSLGEAFETPERARTSLQAYRASAGGIRLFRRV